MPLPSPSTVISFSGCLPLVPHADVHGRFLPAVPGHRQKTKGSSTAGIFLYTFLKARKSVTPLGSAQVLSRGCHHGHELRLRRWPERQSGDASLPPEALCRVARGAHRASVPTPPRARCRVFAETCRGPLCSTLLLFPSVLPGEAS